MEQVEKLGSWALSVTAEPAGEGYVPQMVRWRLFARRAIDGDGWHTMSDEGRVPLPGASVTVSAANPPRAHVVQVAEMCSTAEPGEAIGRLLDAALPVVD